MGTNKETIPLILHAAWSPANHGLAAAERLSFSSEITAEALASIPEELQASVREVAEECDSLS
jgi:hypothetical protein